MHGLTITGFRRFSGDHLNSLNTFTLEHAGIIYDATIVQNGSEWWLGLTVNGAPVPGHDSTWSTQESALITAVDSVQLEGERAQAA